jgi:hypothetical protein
MLFIASQITLVERGQKIELVEIWEDYKFTCFGSFIARAWADQIYYSSSFRGILDILRGVSLLTI